MLKEVTSLPKAIIRDGEFFVYRYKRTMLFYATPAAFLMSENTNILGMALVGLFYCYVFFLGKISRILWRNDKALWFQLFISLFFGLVALMALRFFDITRWLIHEVGYIPDGDIKPFIAIAAFLPLLAAYLDSFKKVEAAYYKSKGYKYSGFLGDL